MLTNKYIEGIPEDSRAAKKFTYLNRAQVEEKLTKIKNLTKIGDARGQQLSQMAIAWLLNRKSVASVLIGASSVKQLKENMKALEQLEFTEEEMRLIDANS